MFLFFKMPSFYEAIIALEKLETGRTTGVLASNFFAINRIIGLLDRASSEGDVIAPFFLHYIAKKFPSYVDSTILPDLNSLPSHRSQAQKWVEAYQFYLEIVELIHQLPNTSIVYVETQKEARQQKAALDNRTKLILDKLVRLRSIDGTISNFLYAKCMELFQNYPNTSRLNQPDISDSLEAIYLEAALTPNYWAMYEYMDFIKRHSRAPKSAKMHKKIVQELEIIHEAQGHFYPLFEYYSQKKQGRFIGQWLIQSAIHGEPHAVSKFYEMYTEPRQQWMVPITYANALKEARRWADIVYSLGRREEYIDLWHCLNHQVASCLELNDTVSDHKDYLSHLVIMVYQYLCFVTATNLEEYSVPYMPDIFDSLLQNRSKLLEKLWLAYDGSLPSFATNNKHMLTDLALHFETQKAYQLAEPLYQQAHELEPLNPIGQYNLANVLYSQNQNQQVQKQIELFLKAAAQGCNDSTERLVFLAVLKKIDFKVDYNLIKKCIERHPDDAFDGRVGTTPVSFPKVFILSLLDLANKASKSEHDNSAIEDCVEEQLQAEIDAKFLEYEADDRVALNVEFTETSEPDLIQCRATFFASHSATETSISQSKKKGAKRSVNKLETEDGSQFSLNHEQAKALVALQQLAEKKARSLTFDDLLKTHRYIHTLSNSGTSFDVSNKGRTSGSRIQIGGKTFHKPHGRDRMAVGAQAALKGTIHESLNKYSK